MVDHVGALPRGRFGEEVSGRKKNSLQKFESTPVIILGENLLPSFSGGDFRFRIRSCLRGRVKFPHFLKSVQSSLMKAGILRCIVQCNIPARYLFIQLSYSTIVSNYLIRIINALQAKRAILAIQACHLRPPRKESPSLSQRTVSSITSESSDNDIIRSGEDAFAFMNWPRPDTESLHRRMPITEVMTTEGVDNQGLLPCFERLPQACETE